MTLWVFDEYTSDRFIRELMRSIGAEAKKTLASKDFRSTVIRGDGRFHRRNFSQLLKQIAIV